VQGIVEVHSSRLSIGGNNSPGIVLHNTVDNARYGIWNTAGTMRFSVADATGAPDLPTIMELTNNGELTLRSRSGLIQPSFVVIGELQTWNYRSENNGNLTIGNDDGGPYVEISRDGGTTWLRNHVWINGNLIVDGTINGVPLQDIIEELRARVEALEGALRRGS
jgi:hypothetical protein